MQAIHAAYKSSPLISHKLHRSHSSSSNQKREREREMVMMKGAVVVAALLVLVAAADGAVKCGDVDESLRPCVGYVTGKEAAPPAGCCEGVRRLRSLPTSTEERRLVCDCVKKAAAQYDGLNSDAIRDLPAACAAPLPFPLALDFDCTTIP